MFKSLSSLLVLTLAVYLGWPLPMKIYPQDPLQPAVSVPRIDLNATVLFKGLPIEVLSSVNGRLLGSTTDGRLYELKQDGTFEPVLIDHSSIHYGQLKADPNSDRVYYLSAAGLCSMRLTASGVEDRRILSSGAEGVPYGLANGLDVSSDGRVFFSDTFHRRFPKGSLMDDMRTHVVIGGEPTGRLMEYDPATGKTSVLLRNLRFANGVAVSPDNTFVIIGETFAAKLWRVWISGERQGQSEQFGPTLPAMPDNLHSDGDFLYVACPLPRNLITHTFLHTSWGRWLAAKLPPVEVGSDPAQFVRFEWATETFPTLFTLSVPSAASVFPHGPHLLLCAHFLGGYVGHLPKSQLPV